MELENTKIICVGEHCLHMLTDENGMAKLKLENGETCVSIDEGEFYDLLLKGQPSDRLHKSVSSLVGILEYADKVKTTVNLSIKGNELILNGLENELNLNTTDMDDSQESIFDYILDMLVSDILDLDTETTDEFDDPYLVRVAKSLIENLVTEQGEI